MSNPTVCVSPQNWPWWVSANLIPGQKSEGSLDPVSLQARIYAICPGGPLQLHVPGQSRAGISSLWQDHDVRAGTMISEVLAGAIMSELGL